MSERADVVVVGGGVTGVALLHGLLSRGVDARLFEAAPEPGGVMRTVRKEGRVLDVGPQRVRLTREVRRFLDDLGLLDEMLVAREDLPLFVHREGKLRRVPFGPVGFLTTDLLSLRGKLRVLLEPLTTGPRADESVASFLTRKFGREAYLHLFGPLLGGLYGSDPRRMPLGHSVGHVLEKAGIGRSVLLGLARWRLRTGSPPPAVSFPAGMQRIADAVVERHRSRVHLGAPVTRIVEGDGLRVETEGEGLGAERVAVTTPAGAAADLLREAAPATADALRRLTYNPLAVVHLEGASGLEGMGYQISLGEEGFATRGATWNASLFGRDDLYTAYLGGAGREALLRRSDGELGDVAAREFRVVTGVPVRPVHVTRLRMPALDASWTALEVVLRGGDLPAGVELCGSYAGRPGIPGRVAVAARLADRWSSELRTG